jgi:hypothetical protein
MTAAPGIGACPNCDAPLEIGEHGTCRACHAHVDNHGGAGRDHRSGGRTSLVSVSLDDEFSLSPFIGLILSTLGPGLGTEAAVRDYVARDERLRRQIQALTRSVADAGVRVRDAGLMKDEFDQHLRMFTPEEFWLFDLAIDVIAMLATLEGIAKGAQFRTASSLRLLDDNVTSHLWKKGLRKAGDGLPAFRELRASVPRHKPRPERVSSSR